ncbi:M61 family metallopeptidase [Aquincola sp. S2]|uniref:M61 family metallopeptidase n=1 Tax=Pseudaquabacterium terrae TaxID=2732868 RepID=A0ABX2EDT8_9BURK|nr:PDZ domain-containing protein [Aquabacterium terrae]NRF66783.1 M61 family metallopeptidase [Aquabacterium terrae]
MISYRIDVDDPHLHLYRVTLTVAQPAAEQRLSLPVWIPGSYMVREFGRHLSRLEARQGRRALALEQLDKTTWLARCSGRAALTVSYRVYAFDTSVRTAFLDARRGFFNGTSVCLRAEGCEQQPHRLQLGKLPAGWDVATALRALGPRSYEADGYDELVDHPVELGTFWRGRFEACGVPHEFVVAGAWPGFDGERLLADTQRICEQQIRFWHPGKNPKPPFDRYVFMLNAVEDGYGGLEHRASTALICNRRDLPRQRMEGLPDGYVTLLGLISHEYFHTWNVKRLKPAEFERYDYTRENYTRLLWFFEGFTSYYDDLLLLRAGLIDGARYLKLLAKAANAVAGTPGRQVQSVADASFDAWVKYYRGDENTPNATISYYVKGSLIGLALDLRLRELGGSLDGVMRRLWKGSEGGPIAEADIAAALQAESGRSFEPELAAWVHGTEDLPLAELLPTVGITLRNERAGFAPSLGLRLSEGPVTGVIVKSVLAGSAAAAAGLSAGDELLAADGWRIRRLDDALNWIDRTRPFELLLVRDQRLQTLRITPPPTAALTDTHAWQLDDKPSRAVLARRRSWFDG